MYIERFWKNTNQIFTILGSGAKQNGEEGIREKQRTYTLYTSCLDDLIFPTNYSGFFFFLRKHNSLQNYLQKVNN